MCLCQWIQPIENSIEIGILQHPTETAQIKGTAKIATLSLQHCRLWVGEDFTAEKTLHDWLAKGTVLMLYPQTQALNESNKVDNRAVTYEIEQVLLQEHGVNLKILVLDGTWRKTHKILMQNAFLQFINRLALHPRHPSNYQIRKQRKAGLSTIEAIYQTLSQLEQNETKFLPLMHAFQKMIDQQLAYRSTVT